MGFSFVQITDHHLCNSEDQLAQGFSPAYVLRKVLHHISDNVAKHIDFIITTGDLVDSASDVSYSNTCKMLNLKAVSPAPGPALITMEGLHKFPTYFLPGNHDDRNHFFSHLFAETLPMSLMNVSFQHKGIQFICLHWGARGKAIAHPDMLSFLSRSLDLSMPSIIVTHHHLVPVGSRWIDAFLPEKEANEAFWNIITQHQTHILGIFSGHAHITYEKIVEGMPAFNCTTTGLTKRATILSSTTTLSSGNYSGFSSDN